MKIKLKNELEETLNAVRNNKALINIGKNGLTTTVFTEISQQLERHTIIKVRFLNNYNIENLATDVVRLTKETQAQLIEKRGKTIILYRS